MPLYVYECQKCGEFEVEQRFSDDPLETHETCGCQVHRIIPRTSFTLKGPGWYADGYAGQHKDGASDG